MKNNSHKFKFFVLLCCELLLPLPLKLQAHEDCVRESKRLKKQLGFLNELHDPKLKATFFKEVKVKTFQSLEEFSHLHINLETLADSYKKEIFKNLRSFDFTLNTASEPFRIRIIEHAEVDFNKSAAPAEISNEVWKAFVYAKHFYQKVLQGMGASYLPRNPEKSADLILIMSPKRLNHYGPYYWPKEKTSEAHIVFQKTEGFLKSKPTNPFVASIFAHENGHFISESTLKIIQNTAENPLFDILREHISDVFAVLFTEQASITKHRNVQARTFFDTFKNKKVPMLPWPHFLEAVKKNSFNFFLELKSEHVLSIFCTENIWQKMENLEERKRWELFKKWLELIEKDQDIARFADLSELEASKENTRLNFVQLLLDKLDTLLL